MRNLFSFRTYAVIKRELKAQVMTKTFIITTVLVPLLIFGGLGFQSFLMMFEEEKQVSIEVVAEDSTLVALLRKEFDESENINQSLYEINVQSMPESDLKSFVEENKSRLLNGELNGIFFVGKSVDYEKEIAYYSNNPKNNNITGRIKRLVNNVLVDQHFSGKAISDRDLEFARNNVKLTSFKVSEKEDIEEDNYGAYIVAFVLAFLLYMSLLMIGLQILRAVIEEKENRVVEVLLSSLHANELMTAKIIATTTAGLLQIIIWMLPFVLLSVTTLFVLPEQFQVSITLGQIAYFVINYGIGLVTFLGLYAAVGAIFDNISEAQQGATPLMFLILIPFYICFTIIKDPSNSIAQVSSLIPFASIIVMPVRMAVIDIPMWEVAVALSVNIATLFFVFSFAGKIYRIGILKTGKKPKWSEVYRWIRQS
ncbi:ABC transporter permease [Aliikangiella coralliicola]|nr:ABC transporter permease [Aliikangiella coralliicola]